MGGACGHPAPGGLPSAGFAGCRSTSRPTMPNSASAASTPGSPRQTVAPPGACRRALEAGASSIGSLAGVRRRSPSEQRRRVELEQARVVAQPARRSPEAAKSASRPDLARFSLCCVGDQSMEQALARGPAPQAGRPPMYPGRRSGDDGVWDRSLVPGPRRKLSPGIRESGGAAAGTRLAPAAAVAEPALDAIASQGGSRGRMTDLVEALPRNAASSARRRHAGRRSRRGGSAWRLAAGTSAARARRRPTLLAQLAQAQLAWARVWSGCGPQPRASRWRIPFARGSTGTSRSAFWIRDRPAPVTGRTVGVGDHSEEMHQPHQPG